MKRLLLAMVCLIAPALHAADSPRLVRLTQDVSKLDDFWRERQKAGAPLIEPLDGREALVTFLWRGDAQTKSMFVSALDGGQFNHPGYLERARMALLPGTDVWYRTYRMPCDLRFSYRFYLDDPKGDMRTDPLNPIHYASFRGDSSVAELPCAPPQPEIRERADVPHGKVEVTNFKNHELQIYTPAKSDEPSSLLVLIGGDFVPDFPVPTILDNLIADKQIASTIAVSIHFSGMTEYVNASRSNEPFARYVAEELVPWLRTRYAISRDPRRVVIEGASAAGAGALFIGMRRPDVFGNVLTQSGGYVYPMPTGADELMAGAHPEAEPMTRELATHPVIPIRIFLAVGVLDDVVWVSTDPRYGYTSVLVATRHLRDVLDAKGYDLRYREFGGGHESLSWRSTFVEGLRWLLAPRS